ncbi:MAG: DEAD/DEAH box helicase [Myxococcales bacterium]|nr:DEAD/DEAH box helicase [Myxococcales bacterium]
MTSALPATPLVRVIGIGPKAASALAKRGFRTVLDLLFFLPRDYGSRGEVRRIAELDDKENACVEGEVISSAARYGRKRTWEAVISDGSGRLHLRHFVFQAAQMKSMYPVGQTIRVCGSVRVFRGSKQMTHPEIQRTDAVQRAWVPVYSEVEGVRPLTLRRILSDLAAATAHRIEDPIPQDILRRHAHPQLPEAVLRVHHPPDDAGRETLSRMRNRLVFDEVFYLMLALTMIRRRREVEPGLVHERAEDFEELAARMFPFPLTGGQRRAMAEIARDLASPYPMNRLLQGDVGSGKTAVAFLAAALVARAGRQTALLAPTEILSDQHAANARRTLDPLGIRTALLTGSTPPKARAAAVSVARARRGARLDRDPRTPRAPVRFSDLGLVIIDEQHRFGVEQRKPSSRSGRMCRPMSLS